MKTLSYLDNLVARHLPETAVIQPRPVSLFEPWPGSAAGATSFSVPAASEEETAVPPPAALPTTTPSVPAIADSLPPPPPSPTPAMRAAQQSASPTPTPATPPAALPSPPHHAPTPRPASPEPTRRPRRQQPVDDTPAAIKPALPRQPALAPAIPVNVIPATPHHQAEPQPAKETHTPAIIREQITLLKSVTETPPQPTPTLVEIVREQPIQPMPPVTAAPAAIRPEQIKPFIPANGRSANHQPPVTPPPEPAPTVQITIGRIEVRATPPPPAKAEQKQPRTPVLSLDDYLRQRNGGRS
jgi:hypothetical protein